MPRVLSASDVGEFRDRVCAAAAELFAEQGYDGFNMRLLAARLGVSAMTAYRYFDSKTEIFVAMRAQAFERLAERLEHVGATADPKQEHVLGICRAYLDYARAEPIRYRLMFDLSQPQFARSAELERAEQAAFEAFAARVCPFAARGRDPQRSVQLLWASLHGMVALSLLQSLPGEVLEELLVAAVRTFGGPGAHANGGAGRHVTSSRERARPDIGAPRPVSAAE